MNITCGYFLSAPVPLLILCQIFLKILCITIKIFHLAEIPKFFAISRCNFLSGTERKTKSSDTLWCRKPVRSQQQLTFIHLPHSVAYNFYAACWLFRCQPRCSKPLELWFLDTNLTVLLCLAHVTLTAHKVHSQLLSESFPFLDAFRLRVYFNHRKTACGGESKLGTPLSFYFLC